MANFARAAAAYQTNSINTASKAELTLMLYDGALKFANIGLMALEEKDIEKANLNIIKAQKIIAELRATLDFKYPVAKDFEVVYDYIYRRLIEANIKKDSAVLKESMQYIREMRDTWKQVMEKTKGTSMYR